MATVRRRRRVRSATVGISVFVVFMVVTAFTGLGAPGMLHRYKVSDLDALASAINEKAGPYRAPDDCWRSVYGTDGPLRSIAAVDYVRSRVVVRVYAGRKMQTEANTRNAVIERVDEIITGDERFSWRMVELEPSPDGWSPLVSCKLVTKGYASTAST